MDFHSVGVVKALIGSVGGIFTKLLFYNAYSSSTLYHKYRQAFCSSSYELCADIEYKIFWEKYYLGEKQNLPMIWIKVKNQKKFSKLVLSVTAYNNKIQFQNEIVLRNLGNTPVQAALPSVPFRVVSIENGMVYTNYDTLHTKIIEAHTEDGLVNYYQGRQAYISPMDNLNIALGREKGDIEKWGEFFNLKFIEMEIKEEQIRLIHKNYRRNSIRSRLRRKIFRMDWLVRCIFWSKNIFFAKGIDKALEEFLKEQEEMKKIQEEEYKKETADID
jgi:hypothetical protein